MSTIDPRCIALKPFGSASMIASVTVWHLSHAMGFSNGYGGCPKTIKTDDGSRGAEEGWTPLLKRWRSV